VLKKVVLAFFKRFARNEFSAKRPKHTGRSASVFCRHIPMAVSSVFFQHAANMYSINVQLIKLKVKFVIITLDSNVFSLRDYLSHFLRHSF